MQPLRFMGVPKTAGSTLAQILARLYFGKPRFVFSPSYAENVKLFEKMSPAEKSKIQLFMGHAPLHTSFPEADQAVVITLLRDPLERVKSFCYHVSENKSEYLQENTNLNLDDFLYSGNKELSNLQTKMLINQKAPANEELIKKMSPAAARDLALENLFTKVAHYGLQEYFDESLMLFKQGLNWQATPWYFSVNIKKQKKALPFTKQHLEKIEELNAIDREVYTIARKKFEEALANKQVDPAALVQFRKVQKFVSFFEPLYRLNLAVKGQL